MIIIQGKNDQFFSKISHTAGGQRTLQKLLTISPSSAYIVLILLLILLCVVFHYYINSPNTTRLKI